MIFSLDHVTLTCSNSSQACRRLKDMGYKEIFSSLGVANPLIKKNFMGQWTASHDLFYFEKPPGFNIEVIQYERVHEARSFLSPVLEESDPLSGKAIIIMASDLELSYKFWSLFGVKLLKQEQDKYQCVYQTPFTKEIAFIISRDLNPCVDTSLDSAGFNGIAFRCTSAINDRQALLNQGIEVTPIEDVTVNGKKLSIFFAKGEQGEKVEVIGYN